MSSCRPGAFGTAFLFALGLSAAAAVASPEWRPADVAVGRGDPPEDVGELLGVSRLDLAGGEGFGGLSAILWRGDDDLLLASDRGWLLQARASLGVDGRLLGIADGRRRRLPLPGGWSRDVEGLAASAGNLLVSVEEAPHVIRFAGPVEAPSEVTSYLTQDGFGFERNRGFEALTDLAGDGWLAIAETAWVDGHLAVTRDGRRYRYRSADGFAPTGADREGEVIVVLERRLSVLGGWQARLACLDARDLGDGGVLAPVELARLNGRHGIDNMEGVALHRRGDDLDILLVSDDNLSPLQRTVLLHYRWPDGASGGCRP